jgi:hypothetical protein
MERKGEAGRQTRLGLAGAAGGLAEESNVFIVRLEGSDGRDEAVRIGRALWWARVGRSLAVPRRLRGRPADRNLRGISVSACVTVLPGSIADGNLVVVTVVNGPDWLVRGGCQLPPTLKLGFWASGYGRGLINHAQDVCIEMKSIDRSCFYNIIKDRSLMRCGKISTCDLGKRELCSRRDFATSYAVRLLQPKV